MNLSYSNVNWMYFIKTRYDDPEYNPQNLSEPKIEKFTIDLIDLNEKYAVATSKPEMEKLEKEIKILKNKYGTCIQPKYH